MWINSFIFILLLIFTASASAEVYKCDEGGAVRFSNTPCQVQELSLEVNNNLIKKKNAEEEHFFAPIYPDWTSGWKKAKELQLERFFEIVYEPIQPTKLQKFTRINQQKLTNLPHSMSAQRFAISVEDIIESICTNAVIYQPELPDKLSRNVFYGQYICSFRRDKKQGELGYFKIMRGENSIYMVTVKWNVEPFSIEEGKPLAITETALHKQKIISARSYLMGKVKLCRKNACL